MEECIWFLGQSLCSHIMARKIYYNGMDVSYLIPAGHPILQSWLLLSVKASIDGIFKSACA